MSFNLPELPNGWVYKSLEECTEKQSVTYGVVQPGTDLDDGIPIIRVNNFQDGRIELNDIMRISPEIESKYSRTRLTGGEVLLTIVGSVGQVAVVPKSIAGFNVARAVAVIHPIEQIGPDWIAICLRSPLSQYMLSSRANTTVQTTINLKDLRALPIPIPPKGERGRIASVITSLDDKIALNRKTNETLEQIAQALFKSWFVDFDPVRAKAEGRRPAGMDDVTAALFPDSFEESEMGEIPKGWGVKSFATLAKLNTTAVNPYEHPNKKWNHYSIPAFDVDQFPSIEFGDEIKSNKYRVHGDAVLVSKLNPNTPRIWLPQKENENDSICSTEFMQFIPNNKVFRPFIYSLVISQPFQNGIMERVTGSTGSRQRAQPPSVAQMNVVAPNPELVEEYGRRIESVLDRKAKNTAQNRTLAALRDTLLPKLLSGALSLPAAEREVSSV